MARVLVVEDDRKLCESLQDYLGMHRFQVDVVCTGDEARLQMRDSVYDLVILDWNLPGCSGPELCRALRAHQSHVPVLMLTAMDKIEDKVTGFDSGADDYLTKPFNPAELLARVKALLRRPSQRLEQTYSIDNIEINVSARTVEKNGERIRLKPLEFDVLQYFVEHPDQVIKPDVLLLKVWNQDSEASIDSVYSTVMRIRKKLGFTDKDSPIQTIYRVGYIFERAKITSSS